jgi:hypothetical protein
VVRTEDAGYVLVGRTTVGSDSDVFVLKLDSSGSPQWNRRIDVLERDEAHRVMEMPDGDLIVAAQSEFNSGSETALVLVRLSANGGLEDSLGLDIAGTVIVTGLAYMDNKILISGYDEADDEVDDVGFVFGLANLDYDLSDIVPIGGIDAARINGMRASGDDLLISLEVTIYGTRDAGLVVYDDPFGTSPEVRSILFTDPTGQSAPSGEDAFVDARKMPDGGFLAVGTTTSVGAGGEDSWVVKLDSQLSPEWQKVYGGSADEGAVSVLGTGARSLVVGYTDSFGFGDTDAWLFEVDGNGTVATERAFGGAEGDRAEAAVRSQSGGFLIAGSTYSFASSFLDFWALKTDDALTTVPAGIQSETSAQVAEVTVFNYNPTTDPLSGGIGGGGAVTISGVESVETDIVQTEP